MATKLFEKLSVAVYVWKEETSEWADFGRGKFRAWTKSDVISKQKTGENAQNDEENTTDSADDSQEETVETCWLSMISIGTLKELLTVHQYREEKMDNSVVLMQKGKKIGSIDPQPYDNGLLITNANDKSFLFKVTGTDNDASFKMAEELIPVLSPYCKTSASFKEKHGEQCSEVPE
eukprot:TRINITY_DN8860_c0_g1_i1.p1 TRINITY_DN8860_c0_g1~~TRINITY_DN8860_c0_g1_i1.p1  ORF type:complete len:177 (-),score=39.53 TRINITY_DN8860_c0_g1_i1:9-539(-)